jgi:hypothetical protein
VPSGYSLATAGPGTGNTSDQTQPGSGNIPSIISYSTPSNGAAVSVTPDSVTYYVNSQTAPNDFFPDTGDTESAPNNAISPVQQQAAYFAQQQQLQDTENSISNSSFAPMLIGPTLAATAITGGAGASFLFGGGSAGLTAFGLGGAGEAFPLISTVIGGQATSGYITGGPQGALVNAYVGALVGPSLDPLIEAGGGGAALTCYVNGSASALTTFGINAYNIANAGPGDPGNNLAPLSDVGLSFGIGCGSSLVPNAVVTQIGSAAGSFADGNSENGYSKVFPNSNQPSTSQDPQGLIIIQHPFGH